MKVSRVHGLPGLGELQQFVAVAKAQSFSGAGRELNQTTATVSAGVKRLFKKIHFYHKSSQIITNHHKLSQNPEFISFQRYSAFFRITTNYHKLSQIIANHRKIPHNPTV